MRFAIRAGFFSIVLVADASRLLAVPWTGGGPVLFVALATWFALRGGALAGGCWGFTGGLLLGLLYADSSLGARALGGLLAGSVPAALRRLLFWRRVSGQAALGAVAGLMFVSTLLAAGLARGELAGRIGSLLPGMALDAALTGAACPFLAWVVSRLERAG